MKFVTALSSSNDAIKESRAKMIADETAIEVDELVNRVKKEKMLLDNEIVKLTDLAPDNTYSLRPGGVDFKASKWVEKLYQTKLDLELKTIELNVAQSIKKEWFTEEAK